MTFAVGVRGCPKVIGARVGSTFASYFVRVVDHLQEAVVAAARMIEVATTQAAAPLPHMVQFQLQVEVASCNLINS